jgi:predicted amidohydrolase
MQLVLAQTQAVAGDLAQNMQDHLRWMERAAREGADLLVFSELSLTGYEPELAEDLAMDEDALPLRALHERAGSLVQRVCVGFPSLGHRLPRISLVILGGPHRVVLHKHHLHEDELATMEPGPPSAVVEIWGKRVGFLICYELSQDQRVQALLDQGAQVLIASVAKTSKGMQAASARLQALSQRYRIPVFVVNAVGQADGVVCGGRSAGWRDGTALGALDDSTPGVLQFTVG